jgi:hypothetical protein
MVRLRLADGRGVLRRVARRQPAVRWFWTPWCPKHQAEAPTDIAKETDQLGKDELLAMVGALLL